jgi:hypothetical protein
VPGPAAAGLSEADRATLRQNDERFATAANAKDFAVASAKYVEVWRKQADASWKIRWDIFNSDVAPEK